MTESRTAAASKARHLNALRRKAPEYVAALRELGYTVTEPGNISGQRCNQCAQCWCSK